MSKELKEIKKLREEIEELRRDLDRKTVLEPYPVPYPVYPRPWTVYPGPHQAPWVSPCYPFWSAQMAGDPVQFTYTLTDTTN